MPGKKLPIWKRKVPDHAINTPRTSESTIQPEQKLFSPPKESMVTPGYRIPRVDPIVAESKTVASVLTEHMEQTEERARRQQSAGQLIPPPVVSTTYRKRSPGEKPKIPRRLQEIQQHLMFEKILKTGTKNTVTKKSSPPESQKSNDLSLVEVKALVEEQKQRMAAVTAEDDEDEDYYNDDSVNIGDDYIDTNVDSPAPLDVATDDVPQAVAEPEAQKKSVRFSLRPTPRVSTSESDPLATKIEPISTCSSVLANESNDLCTESSILTPGSTVATIHSNESILESNETNSVSTISNNASNVSSMQEVGINVPSDVSSKEDQEKQQISLTLPEPGPKSELDEALEEFSRVAEEEEAEELREGEEEHGDGLSRMGRDHTRPRRGRPPRWLKEQTMQMGEIARRREGGCRETGLSSNTLFSDQSQVINEVMKKYPNLFKDNKQVGQFLYSGLIVMFTGKD